MPSIKNRLSKRLPWHLRNSLKSAYRNWKFRHPPFASTPYATYAEFPSLIAQADDDQAVAGRHGVADAITGDVEPLSLLNRFHRNHDLLPFCASLVANGLDQPLSVLDFGGAAGIDYALMKHAVRPDLSIRYTVVEFPAVCAVGREIWADDSNVNFVADLAETDECYDIVYAWGAVHYMPDPIAFITQLAERADRALLIVGSTFAQVGFLRAQTNQSVIFPQWVISLPDTEIALAKLGFKLAFKAAGEDEYNVDNMAPDQRVARSACLLFLKDRMG